MRISDWSSDVCSSDLPHHLHQLDVEARPSPGQRLHRGDDPLDRAGMVRAPDVDQRVGALGLLVMIGEVGAEIGPLPVRLPDRPILVVAETRRSEQRQFDRLPILDRKSTRLELQSLMRISYAVFCLKKKK